MEEFYLSRKPYKSIRRKEAVLSRTQTENRLNKGVKEAETKYHRSKVEDRLKSVDKNESIWRKEAVLSRTQILNLALTKGVKGGRAKSQRSKVEDRLKSVDKNNSNFSIGPFV